MTGHGQGGAEAASNSLSASNGGGRGMISNGGFHGGSLVSVSDGGGSGMHLQGSAPCKHSLHLLPCSGGGNGMVSNRGFRLGLIILTSSKGHDDGIDWPISTVVGSEEQGVRIKEIWVERIIYGLNLTPFEFPDMYTSVLTPRRNSKK